MANETRKVGVASIFAGFATLQVVDVLFDYFLYPTVLLWLGALKGGSAMTCLSLFNCALLLIWTEALKGKNPDFFRQIIGDIRRMRRDMRHGSWPMNTVRWFFSKFGWKVMKAFRKRRWIGFILLSIFRDPFQTMIWFRAGKVEKLEAKDWGLFLASGLLCNITFILRWEVVLWPIKVAYYAIFGG